MTNYIEHIFPFLWLKGEDHSVIEREINAIYDCGLKAFCIESRVHPDFCGEKWFDDVRFILEQAEKRDMQVWLLDDRSYPTGVANGIIEKKYPHLKAWHIYVDFIDVAGRVRGIKIPINERQELNESLIGVYMAERTESGINYDSIVDLSRNVYNNTVYADIPVGFYRIIKVFKAQAYSERANYIDMMNRESVSKLIEAVYEPHYRRFKKYFGKTFVGFFSDEPRLCNGVRNTRLFYKTIHFAGTGESGLSYPYFNGIEKEIGISDNKEWLGLWFDCVKSPSFRTSYMKVITKRYAENFSGALAEWCHKHSILYSCHILEDSGSHVRTVCSAGHYFKAMHGADMAGIDVVHHQIKPFETEFRHYAQCAKGFADTTFNNYTLARLASSCSHLDSEKHGRALCELFGAYGWTESVFEMLYLANHFLTRGINYFIPHAFSMSYGDKDCPPHFYAEGKNPAFKGYKKLFAYMSEMSEKFSGGMEECDVAVLYHDEAEWSGKPFMPCDNVAKVLTQSQIEFDFVYGDVLSKTSDFDYKFLIVPFCEYLTPETRRKLDALKEKVVYVDKKVSLECLPEYLFNNGVERRITTHCKDLRIYSYLKYGKKIGLLFNESGKKIEFRLNTDKKLYAFDYCANKGFIIYNSDVVLAPAQCVFVAEEKIYDCGYGELMQSAENITEFDVFLRDNEETRFKHYKKTRLPFDVNGKNELPNFCGEIEYRFLIKGQGGVLEVDYDGEYCELTVGDNMQTSIGGKAFFVLPVSSKDYIVSLKIANTLSYKIFDDLSKYSYNSAACIYSVKQVIRDKTCR